MRTTLSLFIVVIFIAAIFMATSLFAEDQPTYKIPGVDFSQTGPHVSPSPDPSALPPQRPKKRHSSNSAIPEVGVGASGNNQGYFNGLGKVKIGF